jgi:farnesyl-diphosphate farnesyltransferase
VSGSPLYSAAFLRSVSRSFAISIRLLPSDLRQPVSLAYLLARLADTVADRCALPADRKQQWLSAWRHSIASFVPPPPIEHAASQLGTPERTLLAAAPVLIEQLAALDAASRVHLQRVLDRLTSTMIWELQRLTAESPPLSESELEQYSEGIAGCVGEFWTALLSDRLLLAGADRSAMSRLGRRYGRGLQWINITRDRDEDAQRDRRFISNREQVPRLRRRAQWLLLCGARYAAQLPIGAWRVRIATLLPAVIGLRTLAVGAQPGAKLGKLGLLAALALTTLAALWPRGPLWAYRISRPQPSSEEIR